MTIDPPGRLYRDLVHLWPLTSPPEDYAEEAEYWRRELKRTLGPGRHHILELGVGGGHNLSHLTNDFDATAVDLSDAMMDHSRKLNPSVEHVLGDMRTIRLGRLFDAVLIHDAIDYMISEDDLRAVFATARAHLRPGGVFITAPDSYVETFKSPAIAHETNHKDGEELTFIEYCSDPDPSDTETDTVYVFFHTEAGKLKVEVDRHVNGLFSIETWRSLLIEAGFAVEQVDYPVSEDGWPMWLWVARVPFD